MLRYVKSPSGKVHIAYDDETCCHKKITSAWNDYDDDDLIWRAHRLWKPELWKDVEICLECDKERDDLFNQFLPFPNSTHLTMRAADGAIAPVKISIWRNTPRR
jgi:hypothetical protein